MHQSPAGRRGRGARTNASGRYEVLTRQSVDDGWNHDVDSDADVRTLWRADAARSVITRNQSPDIHFDRSINPYRGCEHGCIYCFARPSHTYLGHSAGLDFERLLYAKTGAADRLRQELARPTYQCEPIAVGVNTDAWQPLERTLRITRQVLEVLSACHHPACLITKASLIERDIDLIADMASRNLVTVSISLTTLDNRLAQRLEPRATAPHRRLRTLRMLSEAGVPTRVSVSPIIPALNEPEIDAIVAAAAQAGATAATALLLRLPHELATLFPQWLEAHYPDRAARVLKAIRSMRGERLNDSEFGRRFTGTGPRADIIRQRFEAACKRHRLSSARQPFELDTTRFRPPPRQGAQMSLLDPS